MDFQRLLLFGALGMVLLLIWQAWIDHNNITNQEYIEDQNQSISNNQKDVFATKQSELHDDVPSTPASKSESKTNLSSDANQGNSLISSKRIAVETDLVRAEIDTVGGDIRRLELLTYPVSLEDPYEPFVLLNDFGSDLFFMQSGLLASNHDAPNHHTLFQSSEIDIQMDPSSDKVSAELSWVSAKGVKYTKIYTFYRNSYYIDVDFLVDNQSLDKWSGFQYQQIVRTKVAEKGSALGFLGRLPSYKGAAIFTPDDKYQKIDFEEMYDTKLARTTDSGWVAMLQHYFVGALLPKDSDLEFYSNVTERSGAPRYIIGYKTTKPIRVPAGSIQKFSARMFVGPKETERMIKADNKLELTVDYGWLTPVSSPLFWVMTYINRVVNNWGVSIILLTLIVKLIFFPLSAASYKSMARMKKMQPRMQTLKERYGDDKQKFQQAMMEIYKKEKINPLGGCLPILIQIPVFIALYWVLLESVELRQAPFALWIKDLSVQDPYYVLPILMGASMFGQHLLNPAPLDPIQQKIMMALPLVFTIFFLWFPAGLVLYWLVNNVLSIAQQWVITRKIQAADSKV